MTNASLMEPPTIHKHDPLQDHHQGKQPPAMRCAKSLLCFLNTHPVLPLASHHLAASLGQLDVHDSEVRSAKVYGIEVTRFVTRG
jgi:hypothetical protein